MTKATKRISAILILFVFLLSLAFYHSSFDYYFFQDDFFEINISKAKNLGEYLSFFKFRDDIIAYRPISLQNYFFISLSIFRLNPVGFRIISYILFFLSAILIFKVVSKLSGNSKIGLYTATLWITSSIHFMTLTWIAAAYNIIGTFFWLLTSYFFLKYLDSSKKIFLGPQSRACRGTRTASFAYLLSFIFYLLTIGSFEFAITWPAILGFYYFYVLKNTFIKTAKIFSPFILIASIYLLLRLFFIKVPQIPEYAIKFNLESIKALFWYILWAFNIPEEFKKQVTHNLLVFNQTFLSEFWVLVTKTFTGAIWVLTLGITVPFFQIIKKRLSVNFSLIAFSIAWFTLAIMPVLFLPNHTFLMYLTLAAIGIYFLVAYLVVTAKEHLLVISVLLVFLITSVTTLNFYKVNSWMIEAQKVARSAAIDLKRQFPTLDSNSTVLYYLPYPWQWQALAHQEIIKAIYNDPSLSIYYNKESLLAAYKNGSITGPVYIYIPK